MLDFQSVIDPCLMKDTQPGQTSLAAIHFEVVLLRIVFGVDRFHAEERRAPSTETVIKKQSGTFAKPHGHPVRTRLANRVQVHDTEPGQPVQAWYTVCRKDPGK